METNMKEITMYECQWCERVFRTPTRHKCKFNPALKNCFSCKHCSSWEGLYPICDVVENEYWDIKNIKEAEYDMQCQYYEESGERWWQSRNTHMSGTERLNRFGGGYNR